MGISVNTSIQLSEAQIRQITTQPGGPVWNAMLKATGATRDRAKLDLTINNLVNRGTLRNSIESTVAVRGDQVVGRIGSDLSYAGYVHEGTQGPIFPQRARTLRFKPKGASAFVFASSVQGTRDTGRYSPYLKKALDQLDISDFL
jgi:hypothetical protein